MIDRKAGRPPGCINVFTTNVTLSHAFLACFYVICMIGSHNFVLHLYLCWPLVVRSPKIDVRVNRVTRSLERMQSIFYLFLTYSKPQRSVLNITSELCAAPWIFSTRLSQRYPLISLGTAEPDISISMFKDALDLISSSQALITVFPIVPPSILPLRSWKARTHGGRIIVWWS